MNPVTVSYTVKKGTAVSGRDFNATAGSLTFNPGQTVQTIPLTELADGQGGNNLTFTVKIASSTATVAGSTATVTLINPLGPMTATVDNPGALPAQGQGSVTFHVSLSSPAAAGHPVTVKYATANGTAVANLTTPRSRGSSLSSPDSRRWGLPCRWSISR